jgi:predicted transcriptional regulator
MIRFNTLIETIANLPPNEGNVFANLVSHGGRARTMDELVEWCYNSKPTVTSAVRVLTAVGLVKTEYVHQRNVTHHVEIFVPEAILLKEETA